MDVLAGTIPLAGMSAGLAVVVADLPPTEFGETCLSHRRCFPPQRDNSHNICRNLFVSEKVFSPSTR